MPGLLQFFCSRTSWIIAADGAYTALKAAGLEPTAIVGDLDSLPNSVFTPSGVETVQYEDQDSTDFEKCLRYLSERGQTPQRISILGGFGARTDHWLSNLIVASKIAPEIKVAFFTESEQCHRVTPSAALSLDVPQGTTVSLFPFPTAGGLCTQSLKWDLPAEDLTLQNHFSQSNEVVITPCNIAISTGCLYVIVEYPVYAG